MRPLGSWVVFADVAGRIGPGEDATLAVLAVVAMPPELRRQIRGKLCRGFDGQPKKWAAGGLVGLRVAAAAIQEAGLPVLIKTIHHCSPQPWTQFWARGNAFIEEMAALTKEKVGYLGPDPMLRTMVYMSALGAMTGLLLRLRGVEPEPAAPRPFYFTVVNDTDISDPTAQKFFASYLRDWPRYSSGFLQSIGVVPITSVEFKREQEEPLLLLPDYLAGAFYHADERARLVKPVAERDDVRAEVSNLVRRHDGLLVHQEGQVLDEYPLDFKRDIRSVVG